MAKTKDESTAVAVAEPPRTMGGLTVVQPGAYTALAENSEAREALLANLGPGETLTDRDLVRVKVPAGGATQWTVDEITGPAVYGELTGVLALMVGRRVLWASEEPTSDPPVCRSDDLERGVLRGELPEQLAAWTAGNGQCRSCPFNQFASSSKGAGKRCKELRVLFLLRKADALPLVIAAPPGSLKTVVPFIKRLPIPHFKAVVTLRLQAIKNAKGQTYSQIVPTLAERLDEREAAIVKAVYTDVLRKSVASFEVRSEDVAGNGDE